MEHFNLFLDHYFELSEKEKTQFENFLKFFQEYNAHTNLSAIRDEKGIIEKHFVDSLYGATILHELGLTHAKMLDIGSGGGFPGIPLKIVCPDLEVVLLDSVGKKTKAQNFFIENLGLEKISAIQDRAENLAKNPDYKGKFDIIISRATAYIDDILTWAKPFLAKNGKILLYKMPSDEEKKSREKICKKLALTLEAEFEYFLGEKDRIIYVFGNKK